MSMDGKYSEHCTQLLKEDRYKKFIRDADSKKTLFENMESKYKGYKTEYNWNPVSYVGDVVSNGNWANADDYARRKIKNDIPHPNLSNLDSKAIDINTVYAVCDKYQELVTEINKISGELSALKDKLGRNNLYVDGMNYEVRIEEIIDKIDKEYKIPMQQFVDEVRDRAPFLHDFQVHVQKDYLKYFGSERGYNTRKNWNREANGKDY